MSKNHRTSSLLAVDSMLAICLDKAGQFNGPGWYCQVNMHGLEGGVDRYLGPYKTEHAANTAGDREINRQVKGSLKPKK